MIPPSSATSQLSRKPTAVITEGLRITYLVAARLNWKLQASWVAPPQLLPRQLRRLSGCELEKESYLPQGLDNTLQESNQFYLLEFVSQEMEY